MLLSRKKNTTLLLALSTIALSAAFLGASPLARAAGAIPSEPQVTQNANGETVATEETNAMERSLENKVREILDGVLKPDRYAVYVQVTMKADAKQLQAYYDERALGNLPGIPAPDPDAQGPANNKLYSMIQSRKVIVVLDKSVAADQEILAKEILKAKLAIVESKGDAVEVRRSEVPTATDRLPASAPAGNEKTENWVRYFLIALAVALAFAVSLLLWQVSLLRERVDARAKLKADIKFDNKTVSDASSIMRNAGPLNNGDGENAGDGNGGNQNSNRQIREGDPISAVELKEKILSLAVSQPKACSLVARKLLSTREGMRKLSVACEAIGFEYTKQLFDTVSPAKWRSMGEYLRQNLNEISRAPVGPILLEIYTDMLAESMGWDPSQSEGPFDFLHKLGDPELAKLLGNEDPSSVAFIAAYWEPEEMSQILSVLNDSKRKETILQIARLRALPREVVQQAAMHFAQRLKVMRSRNEVDVDGSEVVAKMLDSVDSSTEEELLRFIEREDPATRDRLRTHYFSFDSVPLLPQDVLLSVVEGFDSALLIQALAGADEATVNAVLGVLPPKQRAIVEDDVRIANTQNTIPKNLTSLARKQMVVELRKTLKNRGIELSQLTGGAMNPPPPEQPQQQSYAHQSNTPFEATQTMSVAMPEAMPAEIDTVNVDLTAVEDPDKKAA